MPHAPASTPALTRRQMLQRLSGLLGAALSAPLASGLLAGCRVPDGPAPFTPRTLDAPGHATVRAVADHLLPATDTPGALDAGADAFIDLMLTDWYPAEERDRFLAGLAEVDDLCRARFNAAFVDCATESQADVLRRLDRAAFAPGVKVAALSQAEAFFRMMKELTVVGFYTSELGTEHELRWEAVPGRHDGCIPVETVGRSWA